MKSDRELEEMYAIIDEPMHNLETALRDLGDDAATVATLSTILHKYCAGDRNKETRLAAHLFSCTQLS